MDKKTAVVTGANSRGGCGNNNGTYQKSKA